MNSHAYDIYIVGVSNLESALVAALLGKFSEHATICFPVHPNQLKFERHTANDIRTYIEKVEAPKDSGNNHPVDLQRPLRCNFVNISCELAQESFDLFKIAKENDNKLQQTIFRTINTGQTCVDDPSSIKVTSILEYIINDLGNTVTPELANAVWPAVVMASGSDVTLTNYLRHNGCDDEATAKQGADKWEEKHIQIAIQCASDWKKNEQVSAVHLVADLGSETIREQSKFDTTLDFAKLIVKDEQQYNVLSTPGLGNEAQENIDTLSKHWVFKTSDNAQGESDEIQSSEQPKHRFRFLHCERDRTLHSQPSLAETVIVEVLEDHYEAARFAALRCARKNYSRSASHPIDSIVIAYKESTQVEKQKRQITCIDVQYHSNEGSLKTIADSIKAPLSCVFTSGSVQSLIVSDTTGRSSATLSALADLLLNETLRNQRPVVACRSSFFRAFRLPAEYELDAQRTSPKSASTHATLDDAANNTQTQTGNDSIADWSTALKRNQYEQSVKWLSDLKGALDKSASDDSAQFSRISTNENDSTYWLRHIPELWDADGCSQRDTDTLSTLLSYEWRPTEPTLFLEYEHGKHREPTERNGWYKGVRRAPIKAVKLHFFYLNTVVLEWEIDHTKQNFPEYDSAPIIRSSYAPDLSAPPTGRPVEQTDLPFWEQLVTSKNTDRVSSIAGCLDQLHILRHVYSGFSADKDKEPHAFWHLALNSGTSQSSPDPAFSDSTERDSGLYRGEKASKNVEHVSGITLDILQQIVSAASSNESHTKLTSNVASILQSIGDDRAAHLTSMVVEGSLPELPAGQNFTRHLCTRLRMADYAGDSSFYDPAWEDEEAQQQLYTRWWNSGSLYSVADQGFAYLGTGDFALQQNHEITMRRHYYRMFLMVQFYAAVVQGFQARVSCATRSMETQPVKIDSDYIDLLPVFYKFRNQLWFNRLSSQVQANELFDMMSVNSRGMQEYEDLENQIAQTQAYWSDHKEREAESRARTLTAIALPVTIILALKSILEVDLKAAIVNVSKFNMPFDAFSVGWWWATGSLTVIGACKLCGVPAEIGSHLPRKSRQRVLLGIYWLQIVVCAVVAVPPLVYCAYSGVIRLLQII